VQKVFGLHQALLSTTLSCKTNKIPLVVSVQANLVVLANLPRQSECCCIAWAFFSPITAGSFISVLLYSVGVIASGGTTLQ
jgi:hypothetical protein